MGEARLSEVGIPSVEVKQVEHGRKHFGEEISQQNILAGDSEGFGEPGLRTDIRNEVETKPQGSGDGASPEAPGGRGAVLVNSVQAMEEQCAAGAAGDEKKGESNARADGGGIGGEEDGRQKQPGNRDGSLRTQRLANADVFGEPEMFEGALPVSRIEAQEQDRAAEQRRAICTEDQENHGSHKVSPADQPENAVPFGVNVKRRQRNYPVTVCAAENQGKEDERGPAEDPKHYRDDARNSLSIGCRFRLAGRRNGAERKDGRKIHQRGPKRGRPA